ncbi:hypothetical protein [Rhodococcus zopfii]|uniref:hypothetical protein n=1 Tax=Rhodococcus zopfii TaxID=43772 RepID=UPI0011112B66|nr:hypothetical protein [Rhodococcus zopfii]
MGTTETTTTLWMIEDLEPWPDEPDVGQVCEPATQWITPDMMDLPTELVRTISARVEEIETDAGVERRAHLGHGFSTMLPPGLDIAGDTTLTGCLLWDRYLWTSYRTQPAGRALVTDRRPVIQRAVGTPTEYAGLYRVEYQGPRIVHRDGPIPDGYSVVAYALAVTPQ